MRMFCSSVPFKNILPKNQANIYFAVLLLIYFFKCHLTLPQLSSRTFQRLYFRKSRQIWLPNKQFVNNSKHIWRIFTKILDKARRERQKKTFRHGINAIVHCLKVVLIYVDKFLIGIHSFVIVSSSCFSVSRVFLNKMLYQANNVFFSNLESNNLKLVCLKI